MQFIGLNVAIYIKATDYYCQNTAAGTGKIKNNRPNMGQGKAD